MSYNKNCRFIVFSDDKFSAKCSLFNGMAICDTCKKSQPKRIFTLSDLEKASKNRKSVTTLEKSNNFNKCSASFMLNQQGKILLRLFKKGLYIYEANKKS